MPCISGWIIAIKSLLALWEDLNQNHNVRYLMTRRLNQDCVENLLSVIRGKGGHGDRPNPKQFREFLRQVMVDSRAAYRCGKSYTGIYRYFITIPVFFTGIPDN